MNKHKQSPLPFQGQKRNFLTQFKEALKEYPKNAIYVDLFGGSGLLSHTVKSEYPNAKVIYNDYDHYKKRLAAIPSTNKLIADLKPILKDVPSKQRITGKYRNDALKLIKQADKKGYVDFITLSSNLLFSMNYVNNYTDFEKQTLYMRLRKSKYNGDGYLKDVEFVCAEYKELYLKYKDYQNVVFLVDPPYLSTDCSTYKNYWRLSDYLDVLKVLKASNYFYFTSNKSSVIELCEWIETNTGGINPFSKAKIVYQYNRTSHNSGYTDIMLHKRWTTDTTA